MIRVEVVVRTSWNIALQLAAVVIFVDLRSSVFGWFIAVFILSGVGPVLLIVPLVTAVATVRRGRLEWSVQAPFLAAAVCMVTAAALFPESVHSPGHSPFVPVVERLAPETELTFDTATALWSVGNVAVQTYLIVVVWLLVAVLVTGRRVPARSR